MLTTVLVTCAAAMGLWVGEWMNSFSMRFASEDVVTVPPSLPARFLAAFGFGLMASSIDISVEWIIAVPFIAALLIITICDFRHMIIPDIITIPSIILSGCLRVFIHPLPYWDYVLATLLGGGIFFFFKLIGKIVVKSDTIGDGDIKLLLLTGLVLGLKLTLLSFLIFSFIGTLIGVYFIASRHGNKNIIVPFGPVIAIASILSYLWGSKFIFWTYTQVLLLL